MEYVVYQTYLKAASVKGELPDIVYQYISNDSTVPYHYHITNERENALFFTELQKPYAEFISEVWEMKIETVHSKENR